MVVTSIENVLDFICDFNAVVGVHKHPINQKVCQLGCQSLYSLAYRRHEVGGTRI